MKNLTIILDFIKSKQFYMPIITIILGITIYKILSNIIKNTTIKGKNELEKKRRKTVMLLFNNIIKYVIAIIVILIILNIYGIDTTSLIAGLGIAGVVLGLALQDALKDIISGINIIMDNYYVVGDLVKFGDFTGTISEFGLKSTKIISASNEVLIIANRNIDRVINFSQKRAVIYVKIPTAYEANSKIVEKSINKVVEKIKKYDYVDKEETMFLGIDQLDSSSVNYLVKIKCDQGKQFSLKREFLLLIKETYEKDNIKIPYNQLEVHNVKDI